MPLNIIEYKIGHGESNLGLLTDQANNMLHV